MSEEDKIQRQIAVIDDQIQSLLHKRAGISRKLKHGKYDPVLQRSQLERLIQGGKGDFPLDGLRSVFVEIMSQCRSLAGPTTVAFLGPAGTYTHQAAVSEFGSASVFKPYSCVDDIFSAVEKKHVDHSVVAIENSTGGVVHSVLDRFLDTDVRIVGELVLYIRHCLISSCSLGEVKRVFSHPQPFLQCRGWLRKNLPDVEQIEVASTVEGVKRASETENSAAIGSEIAAKLHDMKILASGIQDRTENYTRFVILGRELARPTGSDKTSLIVSIKHKPGSLFEALKPFAERSINLTKIESRPTRQRPWEYVFFIDFEGHIQEERIQTIIKELEPHTIFIKVLGSYPREKGKR